MPKRKDAKDNDEPTGLPLSLFACPNGECADFNRFDSDNLSVAERMGKDKAIRRLYCKTCGTRFSEREGSLMQDTKLPEATVVRIIKCLGHGCSVEATADICEVDTRTVQRLLERAGKRANDFHRLQLENLLDEPLEAVQMDELHGKLVPSKVEGTIRSKRNAEVLKARKKLRKRLSKKRARRGFIRLWP
jgi:transposase-like protein